MVKLHKYVKPQSLTEVKKHKGEVRYKEEASHISLTSSHQLDPAVPQVRRGNTLLNVIYCIVLSVQRSKVHLP